MAITFAQKLSLSS